jgi:hypothetical protein
MALTQVTGPYPIFTDLDGTPLDDGYLYIGEVNQDPETNPVQVYWDSALTIAATQPIRTNNGYAYRNGTPALIYTAGGFSITIRNKREEFVLYSPVGYGFDPAAVSASVVKNDFIGDGVEANFTLSASPSTKLATSVFINGVYQEKDSYSILGNVLTFTVAPPLSSSIEVMTNETGVIGSTNASLVSYTAGFAGAVAQTVQTKLEQYVSVKDFGAVGDTALQAALNASDYVLVNAGTYNGPIDITQSNKTLLMEDGVVFFLPNGTVVGGSVTGPAVLQVSGNNVTVQGDFTVNGNKANNNSTSFPTSVLTGSLNILGDNCRIYGTANVINAYYRGMTVGDSLVSGGEVQGFYANKIHVADADFYSVMLWSVVDWRIEEIRATTSAPGLTRDQRIRTGTQSSATSVCARGYIGLAYTDTNCGFVGEARTIDVSIDTVMTGDGGKIEDCTNVRIGHWNAYDCSRAVARTAFFINNCENCHVDSVIVNNFDDDGSNIPALNFNGIKSCSVGSIVSVGNQTNTPNKELQIRQADGLYLGSVVLRDPVGTCDGFFYDHGYPVQQDIVVEDLISRGHTTWDIVVENRTPITIRGFNSDATLQFPNNTYYPNITDKDFYQVGTWTPTYTTDGTDFTSVTYNSITEGQYVRIGNMVHLSGQIRTDAITVGGATGDVLVGGLPFTVRNLGGAYTSIPLSYVIAFAGDTPSNARAVPNTTTMELYYRATSNGTDAPLAISDLGVGAISNSITFGGTYEIEP